MTLAHIIAIKLSSYGCISLLNLIGLGLLLRDSIRLALLDVLDLSKSAVCASRSRLRVYRATTGISTLTCYHSSILLCLLLLDSTHFFKVFLKLKKFNDKNLDHIWFYWDFSLIKLVNVDLLIIFRFIILPLSYSSEKFACVKRNNIISKQVIFVANNVLQASSHVTTSFLLLFKLILVLHALKLLLSMHLHILTLLHHKSLPLLLSDIGTIKLFKLILVSIQKLFLLLFSKTYSNTTLI